MGATMRLQTKLPIDECERRLASAIDVEGLLGFLGGSGERKPMIGRIRGGSFRIRKKIIYRNSFRPCLFGRFLRCDSQTLVEADFGIHPSARRSVICYYSFLAIWIVMLFASVAMGRTNINDLCGTNVLFLLVPVGMAVLGYFGGKLGIWFGRGDKKAIVTFLKRTLEATDKTS
jgi:hypothetical protein